LHKNRENADLSAEARNAWADYPLQGSAET